MNNMVKLYELREKVSNEIVASSISEMAIRKEYIKMKEEEGEGCAYVTENFISVQEWNGVMKSGFKS